MGLVITLLPIRNSKIHRKFQDLVKAYLILLVNTQTPDLGQYYLEYVLVCRVSAPFAVGQIVLDSGNTHVIMCKYRGVRRQMPENQVL